MIKGVTHFNRVSGVNGVYYGAAGKEVQLLDISHCIVESIAVGDFTDGGSTSGYIDLETKLPIGAVPVGWVFVCTGAFKGDTSAVMQVGVSGDIDRFSADTTGSVFAAGTVGSLPIAADGGKSVGAETTLRITVTSATDFTLVKTDDTGAGTLYFYYNKLVGV